MIFQLKARLVIDMLNIYKFIIINVTLSSFYTSIESG
jgi:hypothetical protein